MNNLDKLRFIGVIKDKVFIGPKTVSMHIINICNLKCIYCWFHSPLMPPDCDYKPYKKEELNYNVFKKIINDCYDLNVERIQISAKGEPTLHSKIIDMINYIKKRGFSFSLITNGTFDKDILKCLAKLDLKDEIVIDLSATNSDKYRIIQSQSLKDLFGRVIKNISYFSIQKKKKRIAPLIKINFILNSKNYDELPSLFKLSSELRIDYLNILNIDISEFNPNLALTEDILKKINDIFYKIKKEKYLLRIRSNILYNYIKFKSFLNIVNLGITKLDACYHGWYYAFITLKGDVTPCCKIHKNLIAGNIYNNSFKEIWFSKNFTKIRLEGKYTLYNKQFNACNQCCFYTLNKEVDEKLNKFRKIKNANL